MKELAEVAGNGAVLLGRTLTCDAHYKRPVRLVTHAHSDHLFHLDASLRECEAVLATPLTRDFLGILKGQRAARKIHPLPYGQAYEREGEKLTLYPAHHIVGSAQALLQTAEGVRVVYTGDIKSPPAEVLPADVLVIEATYGNPAHVRRFRDEVENRFLELVRDFLKRGSVRILGYHGKLQEAVGILNRGGIEEPIVAPEKIFELLRICQAHGLGHRNFFLNESPEGRQALQGRYVALQHMAARWSADGASRILLSGWQFDEPCRRIEGNTWQVALSDHSDFEQLVGYVRRSGPELVIVDGFRSQDAALFAGELRALGMRASAMP